MSWIIMGEIISNTGGRKGDVTTYPIIFPTNVVHWSCLYFHLKP